MQSLRYRSLCWSCRGAAAAWQKLTVIGMAYMYLQTLPMPKKKSHENIECIYTHTRTHAQMNAVTLAAAFIRIWISIYYKILTCIRNPFF